MKMDERKFRILQAIIDDYIMTAVPVGSRTISKKYDMGLSSATIRNEMSDLEELGYLDQPHVSAGRIPSAKAYRLYVDTLLERGGASVDDEEAIRTRMARRTRQMEDVVDHAAQVLSALTHYTAVVLPPKAPQPRIRTVQLVPVSNASALVVIVTDSGIIRDSVIRVPEGMDGDGLYTISRNVTERLAGRTLEEAAEILPAMSEDLRAGERILTGLENTLTQTAGRSAHVGIGGPSNMLTYPEYNDMEKARGFLSMIEARDKLANIVRGKGEMTFSVRIGPETGVPEMADCSIVTATYTAGGGQQGTIGVIGPTRMQYGRVMSIL